MKKLLFLAILSLFSLSFGKVLTYVGSSTASQEDANNNAISGIAKQVSAKVSVSESMTQSELTNGKQSNYNEYFATSNDVKSNVKLKWITIKVLPKNGALYRAEARLDIDEMTAGDRARLKELKEKILSFESKGFEALERRDYTSAIDNCKNAGVTLDDYTALKSKISEFYILDDSYAVNTRFKELDSKIVAELSSIRYEILPAIPVYENGSLNFDVTVLDAQGVVPNFPLKVLQNGTVVSERRTQPNGIATFSLRKLNTDKEPLSIILLPNLFKGIIKAAGLHQGQEIRYKVFEEKISLSVRLLCNESQQICKTIENKLSKAGVSISDAPSAILLKTEIIANKRESIGSSIFSYDVTLTLKGGDIYFQRNAIGVEQSKDGAIKAAINKINFKELILKK